MGGVGVSHTPLSKFVKKHKIRAKMDSNSGRVWKGMQNPICLQVYI